MGQNRTTFDARTYDFDFNKSSSSISLAYMFHIITGCGLFFACYRLSPELALSLTILLSPTIIRTHFAAEIHRQNQLEFGWKLRLKYFATSFAVVIFTLVFAGLAFVAVSLLFGIFAMILGGLMGLGDLQVDSAVLGTAGGMVWGIAAAALAVCFVACRIWKPIVLRQTAPDSEIAQST
jgi:hypothetical protein